ncbi:MAG: glycoside hydrolase family 88 protein, partial [Candidatus Cryptobacteroides sp.]
MKRIVSMLHPFGAALCTLVAISIMSCNGSAGQEDMKQLSDRVMQTAKVQFAILDNHLQPDEYPRTYEDGRYADTDLEWWCSGFFPGSLWYVYEYTSDESIRQLAEKNTAKMSRLMDVYTHHDLGFQVNCSYGNAYRLTGNPDYLPMMEASAAKLARRFSPVVGCIRSWDHGRYSYPVIVDNMMNLEHLLNCSELFSCDSLKTIACRHADVTMKNHFREDNSSYHLVDYNPSTGEIDHKQTCQGFAHESAWSRGQAWGLYGYTMMYERTSDVRYLAQAEKIARYILPRLYEDEDIVPYWDFNAPGTPEALPSDAPGHPQDYRWCPGEKIQRDASAGAIMASAFVTLSTLSSDRKLAAECKETAEKLIRTLASAEYLAEEGEQGGYLIKHCAGNI